MKKLTPGTEIDGFIIDDCIHAGGMAHIYSVRYAQPKAASPGFPMVMKIPRMTAGDGAENIVSFEVELQILPALHGPMCRSLWPQATCCACPTSSWSTWRAKHCSTGWISHSPCP